MNSYFVPLMLFLALMKGGSTAVLRNKQEESSPSERKTMTMMPGMMPMYMTAVPSFETKNLSSQNPNAGADSNVFGEGEPTGLSMQQKMNALYHPMNPFSPMNPVNMMAANPFTNPMSPMSPMNPMNAMTMAGQTDKGFGLGRNDSIFDQSLKRSAFPELQIQDACQTVQQKAILIANKILQRQNAIVFKEIMNYVLKSKFLLGITEVKLGRTLKKKMVGVLKQYSSLTEDNVQFIDSKYAEILDDGIPEDDADLSDAATDIQDGSVDFDSSFASLKKKKQLQMINNLPDIGDQPLVKFRSQLCFYLDRGDLEPLPIALPLKLG